MSSDISKQLNEELLSVSPDSQAVEADEEVQYEPEPEADSNVVALEPPIISIGRAKRQEALRKMQSPGQH